MPNYTKIAIKGASVLFIIGLVISFLSYLFRIILAKNLSVSDYGLVFAIISFFGLFSLFKNLGIPSALAKFIAEHRTTENYTEIKKLMVVAASILIPISLILTILIYFSADYLAVHYFHNASASTLVKIYSLTFLLSAIMSVASSTFRGYQRNLYFVLGEFIQTVTLLTVTYTLLYFSYGVFSPIIATVIALFIEIIIFFPILFKKVFPKYLSIKTKLSSDTFKKILLFGLPVILTGLSSKLFSYMDIVMLTFFKGLYDVGLYSAALPTTKILWRFGAALVVMLLPLTSELWMKKEVKKIKDGLNYLYKYLYIISLPVIVIMLIFPNLILEYLFGKEYVVASLALQILAVGSLFTIGAKINFSMITGIGKPKFVAKTMLIGGLFNLVMNLILIPLIGYLGAAIATTLSFLLMFIMSLIGIKKLITLKLDFNLLSKITFSGIVFGVLIFILKGLVNLQPLTEFAFVVIASGLIYLGLIFILNIVTVKEIKNIFKRMRSKQNKD
jgi:O-antigen/teichoic acid export membrane protein